MVFSVIKSFTLSPGPLSLMIRPNRELGSLFVLGLPRPLSPGTRPGEWGCELTSKFPAQVGAFWKKLILYLRLVSLQVEPRTKALPTEADTLASFPSVLGAPPTLQTHNREVDGGSQQGLKVPASFCSPITGCGKDREVTA